MDDAPQANRESPDKDAPLRYDTRLLGRILGETVRAQEGERVFDLVEHIRRTGCSSTAMPTKKRAASCRRS